MTWANSQWLRRQASAKLWQPKLERKLVRGNLKTFLSELTESGSKWTVKKNEKDSPLNETLRDNERSWVETSHYGRPWVKVNGHSSRDRSVLTILIAQIMFKRPSSSRSLHRSLSETVNFELDSSIKIVIFDIFVNLTWLRLFSL